LIGSFPDGGHFRGASTLRVHPQVARRPTTAQLFGFSRARVGYKAPGEIIVIDEMPINAVGKVDRVALKQMAEAAVNRHLA
jgi:acyl-CoA synthetase (AMP-forming)/AMP-acid ligase II